MTDHSTAVAVIGGGQAGLATGYYLRRAGFAAGIDYVIFDARPQPGGAWQDGWQSLRLFSPSDHSSLPGWRMPTWTEGFPPADHVRDYLTRYEKRYDLPVQHDIRVTAVRYQAEPNDGFWVETTAGQWQARAVVSATGTWDRPFWPVYPGMRSFRGRQLHTADYRRHAPPSGIFHGRDHHYVTEGSDSTSVASALGEGCASRGRDVEQHPTVDVVGEVPGWPLGHPGGRGHGGYLGQDLRRRVPAADHDDVLSSEVG